MIKFSRKPDSIFEAILKDTFEDAISSLILNGEEYFNDQFLHSNKFLTLESAIVTLEHMRVYHDYRGVYRLNKYHLALIIDALLNHCMYWMEDDYRHDTSIVEGTKLQRIYFDDILEIYFNEDDLNEMFYESYNKDYEVSRIMVNIFDKPSYEELQMEKLQGDDYTSSKLEDEAPLFHAESVSYPDFKILDGGDEI